MIFKVVHILLALNLFISSFGLIAFEHMCSKNGSTFSFFLKPESCCSKKKAKSCSAKGCTTQISNHGAVINKKPCCEDKTHYKKFSVNATEKSKVSLFEGQPVAYYPVFGTSLGEINFISENEKTLRFFLYKPPPLPLCNIRVLYQSFLC